MSSIEGLETICNGFYTLLTFSPKSPPATFFCTYALLITPPSEFQNLIKDSNLGV